jgi:hypothetical protein
MRPHPPDRPDFAVSYLITALLAATIVFTAGCSGIASSTNNAATAGTANPYPTPNPGASGMFFGINTNSLSDTWPGTIIPLTSWRSLGSQVKWADIDTLNNGQHLYDFSKLDQWLSQAKGSNTDVLFTVYATPSWASARGSSCTGMPLPKGCMGQPNMGCAFQAQDGPGICDPPLDLSCDGTGANQTFIDFVTALIQHAGPGTIKYWEIWNEPNVPTEWHGDADCPNTPHAGDLMLARMARDMKAIVSAADPKAKFTTPPVAGGADWVASYLNNTDGGSSADIIAFHGYINNGGCPSNCPVAEAVGDAVDQLTAALPPSDQGKPIFNTEGSWGSIRGPNNSRVDSITDPDQQASFLARYYLIQMGKQVAKFYWWNWNIPGQSEFYDSSTNSLSAAGNAYVQLVRWTNGGGASVSPCSANGTVWTCSLKSPSGAQAEAIWDTSQTCAAGTCSTVNLGVPSQFNAYLDLAGNATNLAGATAPVSAKPILLITQ